MNAVTLYYRAVGETDYISAAMNNSEGNTYAASIPGSAMLPPGVQYYIEATDGASFAYSGRANTPHTIAVENSPVVTNVSPNSGSQAGGTPIIISGITLLMALRSCLSFDLSKRERHFVV